MYRQHAVIFIPPNLTDDGALSDRCRVFVSRRGYTFVTVCRDWDEVEWLLGTGRAHVVVFANPAHIQKPVPAAIANDITSPVKAPSRRDPGQQTIIRAVGSSAVPKHRNRDRAVILIPPGEIDPHGARCAQLAERQGLQIAGVVQDLAAAISMLDKKEANVLIVGDERHLQSQPDLRIEIVASQPTVSGARRSKIIRRRGTAGE